ncbi:MAG: pilus assembly protein PilP [Pseudomonadota bacterium]
MKAQYVYKAFRFVWATVLATALTACGGADQDELRQWVAEQRLQVRPAVAPITAPKRFVPQPYVDDGRLEPFDLLKLTQAMRRDAAQPQSSALIAPELSRRKEALESFPLDTMVMVGSLSRNGQPVALVSIEKLLYQVRVGSYLGLNYGRVGRITESEISLREIVQDAAGEWVERTATLQLQDRSK